tara:strand:- start:3522 stop:4346 length:825 start_codon:yes stop_codon:yes gene_type:complete
MSYINLFSIVLGSCIGSFLNVVIYRFPRNKSFVLNRSQCPSCRQKLNLFDLFPIISWVVLRGRCRYCSSSISKRYPLVELFTSILFLLCFGSKGFTNDFSSSLFVVISGWVLVSYLIVLCFIDIDEMILPNSITFSGSVVGLFLALLFDLFFNDSYEDLLLAHLFAYILAFFGFITFSYIVKFLINKPGLGGGDAKLFAMSGAWLGLNGLEVTIVLSFLISGFFVFFGLIFRLIKRGQYIPFGPFICISMFMVWFFGKQFWFDKLSDIFWWKYL